MKSSSELDHGILKELQNYKLNKINWVAPSSSAKEYETKFSKILKMHSPKSLENMEFINNEYMVTTTESLNSLNEQINIKYMNTTALNFFEEKTKKDQNIFSKKINNRTFSNMFSDQNFTSRNNIPSKNDVNFKEFALNDHIEKDNLIINFPIEHEENDLITIENDKEKHKSKGKSVLSLKKFTQTQELQMRNFENIMKENENLTKKNKEYLKEIEFLQKTKNKKTNELCSNSNLILNETTPKKRTNYLMSKTSIKETKEHSNNKESKDFQYYKELAEKYQFQCSLMASEIISLRSSLSKLNFDRAKNLEIDIN